MLPENSNYFRCRPSVFWFTLIILTGVVIGGVWFAVFPLGVPGEWEWERITPVEPFWLWAFLPLVTASLYIGFVWIGTKRIEGCCHLELAGWLIGLAVGGFAWLWVVQESAPAGYQLSKTAFVLYPRESSGYFQEARDEAGNLTAYLAHYEKKMAQGDVLHIGTHPPGLVIIFRGLLGICRTFPGVVDFAAATEPDSVRIAFDALQELEPISRTDRAVLWLSSLLLHTAVVVTVIPLFGLVVMTCSRTASWLAVAFWPFIPCLAVFSPKSDCLFPLLTTTILWLWLCGLTYRSRWLLIFSGFIFWIGMTLSIVFLPVVLIAILIACWNIVSRQLTAGSMTDCPPSLTRRFVDVVRKSLSMDFRELVQSMAVALFGFAAPCAVVMTVWRVNLPVVWMQNIHNHAAFYDRFPRTYWKWLLVNPIEFAIAAGIPLFVLALWAVFSEMQRRLIARGLPDVVSAGPGVIIGHVGSWLLTIGLLWLSGKNSGEVARLWIFLMPFLIWIAAPTFQSHRHVPLDNQSLHRRLAAEQLALSPMQMWCIVFGLQCLSTLVLVTHVAGFQYHP